MKRSGKGSGGGPWSKNIVKRPTVTGERAREMRHEGVSQIGSNRGNHATDAGGKVRRRDQEPVRGAMRPSGGPGGVPLGNEVAKNVGGGGPGTGRVVYGSGMQATHGPVAGNPKPAGRDILSEFGRESANVVDRK